MADQSTRKRPTLVMTAGSIASGKSHAIRASQWAHLPIVDPDVFKKDHPDYSTKEPSGPGNCIHIWSQREAALVHAAFLEDRTSHILDGTGSNLGKYLAVIKRARARGFRIVILWAQCSLATAIRRDIRRERTVGEAKVRAKYPQVLRTMSIACSIVDQVCSINTER